MSRSGFRLAFLILILIGLADLVRSSVRDREDAASRKLAARRLDPPANPNAAMPLRPRATGIAPSSGALPTANALTGGRALDGSTGAADSNETTADVDLGESDGDPSAVADASEDATPSPPENSTDGDESGSDEVVSGVVGDTLVDAALINFPSKRLEPGPYVIPRASLGKQIDNLLAAKALANVRTSVCVISTADGQTLYEREGSTPRIVASNNKLFTLAAALSALGRGFQFTTKVYVDGSFANGAVTGNLVIVGDGDPDAVLGDPTEKNSLLGKLVAAITQAGVKSVSGKVIVDDHVFDRQYLPPQWQKSQLAHDYAAPVAGFSLFENCAVVRVRPAAKVGVKAGYSVLPQISQFATASEVTTVGAKAANVINVPAPIAIDAFKVRGSTPFGKTPVPLFVPLANPGAVHPIAVAQALARGGVKIGAGSELAAKRFEPGSARLLCSVKSPLQPILRKLMKDSSNVLAEHVYKRVGFDKYGRGTILDAGRATIEALRSYGVDTTGAVSVDGSGLSRGNLYSARQAAQLLAALYRESTRDLMIDVLPIGGVDGTLANRFTQKAYKGRVRAKTGYINGVAGLSGYATTDDGEVLSFSILMNGFKSYGSVKGTIDQIAKLLVDLQGRKK